MWWIFSSSASSSSCSVSAAHNYPGGSYSASTIALVAGFYKEIKTTVCSKVSILTVDHSDNTQLFNLFFWNFINVTDSIGGVDAPWVGHFTILVFLKVLTVGQSTNGSAMVDTNLAFVSSLSNFTDEMSFILVSFLNSMLSYNSDKCVLGSVCEEAKWYRTHMMILFTSFKHVLIFFSPSSYVPCASRQTASTLPPPPASTKRA